MSPATLQAIDTLLAADGATQTTREAVQMTLRYDGMIPTGVFCRQHGISRHRLYGLCKRHGVRVDHRMGPGGNLVDARALLSALEK